MSNVTQFPDKYVAENDMLNDVGELVNKYNGRVTNVAMLGVLQSTLIGGIVKVSLEISLNIKILWKGEVNSCLSSQKNLKRWLRKYMKVM